MKEVVIKIAIFSFGVGVGVLGTRAYFDQKYQKLADEEIESCKAIFEKKKAEYYQPEMKVVEKGEEIKFEHTGEPIAKVEKVTMDDKSLTLEATLINSYSSSVDLETKNYSEFYAPKKVEEAQTLSPKEDEPFDISVEEYEEDTEFQKVTLNLYLEDGVLCYEESEEVAEESDTVGSENLDDFSRTSFSTAYFRNPKEGIDYEVIKVDGSYKELIAGF